MQENPEMMTIPQMVEDVRAGKMPRRNFITALTALGLSAAGAATIATVAASHAFASKPSMVLHPAEEISVESRNLQLHDRHLVNQTQGNTDAMSNDYAENAVVEDSMHREAFVGRAAIMQRKGIMSFPDLQIKVNNRVAYGPQVSVEWEASGTHTTSFPGFPATGRPFSFHGVTVVIRHDGKIVRESIYYNMEEVRRQLGPS